MSAPRYAKDTSVPTGRSQYELEQLLARYGATQFARGWDQDHNRAMVQFVLEGWQIRMTLPLPDPDDEKFRLTPSGQRERTAKQAKDAYDQEVRRRWRALVAVVKAKLIAVAEGISTFEREFLSDLVLADNQTFSQWAGPQLEAMRRGAMPQLLPGPKALEEG